MARRTKEEAQETRERILNAAQTCYLRLGVSGTSLKEIADEAGCTRGAVYWHFQEKLDILRAVLERGRMPFHHRLQTVANQPAQLLPVLPALPALPACLPACPPACCRSWWM